MESTIELFRHVSAEKAVMYRCIMDAFATARRQYRLQLRPDEVLAEAAWPGAPPRIEELTAALSQLTEWGNLESQPDTARVSTLSDFYRARFLYRLSHGGEAVEAALAVFAQTIRRRAELQTVALEDIATRLQALKELVDASGADSIDVPKVHEILRDLVRVVEDLADNAQPAGAVGAGAGLPTVASLSRPAVPGRPMAPPFRPGVKRRTCTGADRTALCRDFQLLRAGGESVRSAAHAPRRSVRRH